MIWNNRLYILLGFLFIAIIIQLLSGIGIEGFMNPLALAQNTKCVDCEIAMGPTRTYLGGSSKCFDCEQDILNRTGNPLLAELGQPSKCFDCEAQVLHQMQEAGMI